MGRRSWLPKRWVAVDLDRRTVRGVVARRWGSAWIVESWAEEATAGAPPAAQIEAFRRLLARLPRGRLVLVFPRSLFLERVLAIPRVGARHLFALVRQELDAALPWPAGERWEGFALFPDQPSPDVTPSPSSSRPSAARGRAARAALQLLAFAAHRSSLEAWESICRTSGRELVGVVPSGVGLANAFRLKRDPGRGFLLGGRDEADLVALIGEGWGFSRSFPWSEAEAELERSRQFAAPDLNGSAGVWIPEGVEPVASLSFPDTSGAGPLQRWRPADAGQLPPAYWAAWGALQAAAGDGPLPLALTSPRPVDFRRSARLGRAVAGAAIVAVLAGMGLVGYRIHQRQAAERAAAARAVLSAEVATRRTVAFPVTSRLAALNALAEALPAGTRLEALRLEGDRLAELRATAPRASAVLSALAEQGGLAGVALSGPVTRRGEANEEAFTLTGRVVRTVQAAGQAPTGPAGAAGLAEETRDDAQAVVALHTLGLAELSPDRALTRLLLLVERAAAGASVRLETKSAQPLPAPPGRQRLGLDASFAGGDRELAAFLSALGGENPLLSLEGLSARRLGPERGGAALFRLQLVLDRPAAPPSAGALPAKAVLRPVASLARAVGLAVPRKEAYPALLAGRLFGAGRVTRPASGASSARPSPSPVRPAPPPPSPPRSTLVLLGVVYDPVAPRALIRPAAGGPTEVVKVGDQVGGEKVVEIRKDGIIVEVGGNPVTVPLP